MLNDYTNKCLTTEDVEEISRLFNMMYSGLDTSKLEEINQSTPIMKVKEIVSRNIIKNSETREGNLWINLYQEMVSVIKSFIKAERIGDWKLLLGTTLKMLPYFASAGHNNYLKSAYLYTQNMIKLENENQEIHEKFMSGFHVIRRSNKFWCGLSSDLVIKQELMHLMKSSGTACLKLY